MQISSRRNLEVEVINLRNRPDRRAAIEREMSRIGWQPSFFFAEKPTEVGRFPSIGARGCFESHLTVLRRHITADRLILLEDDVNFIKNFRDHWAKVEAELDQVDWSICYLGHFMKATVQGLVPLHPQQAVVCAHFMMFNGPAITRIVDELSLIYRREAGDPRGGPMHVDGAYSTIRAQNPNLATWAYAPSLGYQRSSRTDIGNTKWFDRSKLLIPVVGVVRAARTVIRRQFEE